MHQEVLSFIQECIDEHPCLVTSPVLELGSYDMNGSVRQLFLECEEYLGVDTRAGPGVDVVCKAENAPKHKRGYQCVVSTEMLEHDPKWPESVGRMIDLVRDGGIVLITAAAPGRKPHGFDFSKHYENITPSDLFCAIHGAVIAAGRSIKKCQVRLARNRPIDVQAYIIIGS